MIDSSLSFLAMGLVQGLTEFLPVSSSAHLALAGRLLQIQAPPLAVQVWVHLATLIAVLVALRRSVWDILRSLIPGGRGAGRRENQRLALGVVVGTLPAVAVGLFLHDRMDGMLLDVRRVGIELLVTSLILFLSRYFPGGNRPLTMWRALLIGVAQAVAILPGISRSGTTLTAGLALGLPAAEVARFSFLLCIPAILGAAVLDASALNSLSHSAPIPLILSFLASGISGYVAIRIVWRVMQSGRLAVFAPYCAVLGLAAILLGGRIPG